jgi:hypothetical protein
VPTIGLAVQQAGWVGTTATNTFPPTPSPDCDRVIGNLHFRWAELRANVWVTYVASDANLSDDPSRRSSTLPDDTLEGMGARKVPFVLPDLRLKVRSQSEI